MPTLTFVKNQRSSAPDCAAHADTIAIIMGIPDGVNGVCVIKPLSWYTWDETPRTRPRTGPRPKSRVPGKGAAEPAAPGGKRHPVRGRKRKAPSWERMDRLAPRHCRGFHPCSGKRHPQCEKSRPHASEITWETYQATALTGPNVKAGRRTGTGKSPPPGHAFRLPASPQRPATVPEGWPGRGLVGFLKEAL